MRQIWFTFLACILFAAAANAQDAALELTKQPMPEAPKAAADSKGEIALRVEFLDSGRVGDVTVLSAPTYELGKLAAAAAHRIEFTPEKKAGRSFSTTRTIFYYFDKEWTLGRSGKGTADAEPSRDPETETASSIVSKAVAALGGQRYLAVKTQIGRGRFSVIRQDQLAMLQTFIDIIRFPDMERTEFKQSGTRTVQANSGDTGWVFDGDQEILQDQSEQQIAAFKRGLRVSLDNLLRGYWKGEAELSYVGKRPSTLGRRNEVVRLTYKDGFSVEFEFSADDALPQKVIYSRPAVSGDEVKEEDHYAQFVEFSGIKVPLVIDRFENGDHASRINYESVEFNRDIPDAIFAKPANAKEAKKELKL
ncbi:MAG: outer membrane lipoprotein-sorting protein [Acidobacteria bacterium]|nr:outer membrane lipoprotein-sorting protein [Acidobacteriota bacterium]